MISIVHSGLPEFSHCENSLRVCKQFAEYMGFHLIGEVIIPDTGAIEGTQIDRIKRISAVLDQIINVIRFEKKGDQIKRIIAKPSLPPYVFRIIGNIIMKYFAKKNKANVFQKGYDY